MVLHDKLDYLQDFLSTRRQTSFFVKLLQDDENDLTWNSVNSNTGERLIIQHDPFEFGWLIARVPQNSPDSPQEVYENIIDSFECLSSVVIHV